MTLTNLNCKLIAIGGIPASGKTTLMKNLKRNYKTTPFKYGKVKGEVDTEKGVYFIGVFDGTMFEGTDKLSMSVQPDFMDFLEDLPEGVVVYEGDRLFNNSLFVKYPCNIYILNADTEIEKRHVSRNDNQSETFLKGRITKIKNVISTHPHTMLSNNNYDEMNRNINEILKDINDVK